MARDTNLGAAGAKRLHDLTISPRDSKSGQYSPGHVLRAGPAGIVITILLFKF